MDYSDCMEKGLLIGIVGKARSGKDTFTNYLVNILSSEHNREFKTTAFAYRLKQMCVEHFHLNREQLWGDSKEVPDKRYRRPVSPNSCCMGMEELPSSHWTPREIMQNLGSFYRSIDPDFWVRKVDENWKYSNCPDLIITDARMPNECDYIKENGILIRIIREDKSEIHNMQHESETALDNQPYDYFDLTIVNNWGLKELQVAAVEAAGFIIELEKLKKKGREYNG